MMTTGVWVTGWGAVTAAGPTSRELADLLQAGRSAVRPLPDLPGTIGARVDHIPPDPIGRRLEREGRLFVTAAREAWHSAGLDGTPLAEGRAGLIEGSSLGPMAAVLDACSAELRGQRAAHPADVVRFMPGAGGSAFAQAHEIRGPVLQISAGSVSAACAVGEACEKIANGQLDVAVAGGADCPLERSVVERFAAAGVIPSDASALDCRPFDRARQGTVLGEGAGVVLLESAEHASRRGAAPRAIVRGYGFASEGHSPVNPDPTGSGVRMAARAALSGHPEPSWCKAHGTGTQAGDLAEYRGLVSVFGSRLASIPVTSLKPAIGHCLGASGAVEMVAALLALERAFVPATLGTSDVDPELALYDVVLVPRLRASTDALLLSESFGGRCVALLVSRP